METDAEFHFCDAVEEQRDNFGRTLDREAEYIRECKAFMPDICRGGVWNGPTPVGAVRLSVEDREAALFKQWRNQDLASYYRQIGRKDYVR